MVAEASQACRDLIVACSKNPTITSAAEILRRIETEASDQTHRARAPSIMSRANRLRRIFNHGYSMTPSKIEQGIHLRALAVDMDGHDGFRAWRDRVSNTRRIDVIAVWIDIDENGTRAESSDA